MGGYGLLGRKLSHSYSPRIHALLADYSYDLYEVEPEQLQAFLEATPLSGMNVTIPYKEAVIPFCAELSPIARKLHSVNTLVRREDGSFFGDNTDYAGFCRMVEVSGISVADKTCLVLGSGGASHTVRQALSDLGAASVTVISRTGPDNYENLNTGAEILVNTTPVGMYPDTGCAPVELRRFSSLCGVFDVIYNPARTKLLLSAEELGVPCISGLTMLVAQARRAAELFTESAISDETAASVTAALARETENIILIGMPGCGKTAVGQALADKLQRPFYDLDAELTARYGDIPTLIETKGETAFRALETAVAADFGRRSGCVIATGGGIVTRQENYPLLHQNGVIVRLTRPLSLLPTEGRPLSQRQSVAALSKQREPLYARFADITVPNENTAADTADRICEVLL